MLINSASLKGHSRPSRSLFHFIELCMLISELQSVITCMIQFTRYIRQCCPNASRETLTAVNMELSGLATQTTPVSLPRHNAPGQTGDNLMRIFCMGKISVWLSEDNLCGSPRKKLSFLCHVP